MTYELDKSQYDGSVFVWSDPCLEDTDGDGLDDLLDNNPIDSTVHEFLIYESEKNDIDLKTCGELNRPEDFQYADKSKGDLEDMSWINWADFLLKNENDYETSWKLLVWLLSSGDMVEVSLDMVNHFMVGTGEDYHNNTLTKEVENHINTHKYVDAVIEIFENLIKSNNGKIFPIKYNRGSRNDCFMVNEMKDKEVYEPIYNDYFSGLGICVDSLYGNKIEVTSFKFDGKNYEYTLHFTMYDIYGLGSDDLTDNAAKFLPQFGFLDGFRSWYILQHYNKYQGNYQPYISYMEFDKTFEGTI